MSTIAQSRNKHHGFRGRKQSGETGGSWHEGLLGDNGMLVLPGGQHAPAVVGGDGGRVSLACSTDDNPFGLLPDDELSDMIRKVAAQANSRYGLSPEELADVVQDVGRVFYERRHRMFYPDSPEYADAKVQVGPGVRNEGDERALVYKLVKNEMLKAAGLQQGGKEATAFRCKRDLLGHGLVTPGSVTGTGAEDWRRRINAEYETACLAKGARLSDSEVHELVYRVLRERWYVKGKGGGLSHNFDASLTTGAAIRKAESLDAPLRGDDGSGDRYSLIGDASPSSPAHDPAPGTLEDEVSAHEGSVSRDRRRAWERSALEEYVRLAREAEGEGPIPLGSGSLSAGEARQAAETVRGGIARYGGFGRLVSAARTGQASTEELLALNSVLGDGDDWREGSRAVLRALSSVPSDEVREKLWFSALDRATAA